MAVKLLAIEPIFQNKIWGGRRLADEYGYALPDGAIGECWAISAHPHGDCRVSGGPFDGAHLSELWAEHRELFGGAPEDRFPLLVKIIDAEDDLSIQVHPDDAYAAEHEDGSLGKRECWYVLAADEGAQMVVGQRAKDRAECAEMIACGRWDELLNKVPVRAGEFFAVEPGCVHALCKGMLILETQQSSDVTYRLYDYDRLENGRPRDLHIEKSLDVIDYAAAPPASGEIAAHEVDGVTHLLHNESFDVVRLRAHRDAPVELAQTHDYLCMSVVGGAGELEADGERRPVAKGDHLIATALCERLVFTGELELICSYVERA